MIQQKNIVNDRQKYVPSVPNDTVDSPVIKAASSHSLKTSKIETFFLISEEQENEIDCPTKSVEVKHQRASSRV